MTDDAGGAHLESIVIEPPTPAEAAVIMLHGLGASGEDFGALPDELDLPPRPAIRWILPHAPVRPVTINAGMAMRAWHDVASLDSEGVEDEAGIIASARAIDRLLDTQEASGIPARRIVLAGFSQGGAMALFTGLRRGRRLAGIAALSCWLPLARAVLGAAGPAGARPAIFMAHGTLDPVVLPALGIESRDLLAAAGFAVEWHEYPMPHTVCEEELVDLGAWIRAALCCAV